MFQPEGLTQLAHAIKERSRKNIWCYRGYTFEKLLRNPRQAQLLKYIDVLVDGKFKKEPVSYTHLDVYKRQELFEDTVKLINDFKEYFLSHGEPVCENPSPGNKAGGISTLEDKALGCTQKCGTSYVEGVRPYGERLKVKGLNLSLIHI